MLLTDLACSLSKEGNSLLKIAQALKVEPDAVLDLIAMKTRLDKYTVEVIFNSIELGLSINRMPTSVPVEALKIFVPEAPQTVLTSNYRAVIREKSKDFTVAQIAAYLGITNKEVEDVLASEGSESDAPTKVKEVQIRGPIQGGEKREFKVGLYSEKTQKPAAPSQAPRAAREVQIRKPILYEGEEAKTQALRQPQTEIEPKPVVPSIRHVRSSSGGGNRDW